MPVITTLALRSPSSASVAVKPNSTQGIPRTWSTSVPPFSVITGAFMPTSKTKSLTAELSFKVDRFISVFVLTKDVKV